MSTATQSRAIEPAAAKSNTHRPWWLVSLEFVALSLFAIAALEGFCRICGVGGQEFLYPDPIMGCRQIPGKQVIWRFEGFSDDLLNSLGRRDVEHALAKPPGVTRVVVLGDSATEGLQVPLKDNYCRLLESMLNSRGNGKYEVLNFGCSSYSTGQQVLLFEKQAAQYRPDVTVVLYVRGAALQNAYNPYKKAVEPRPYFYLDGRGKLQEDDSILHEQAAALRPNPVMDFLRCHSRIYGIFSQANLSLSIHEPLYNKVRGWLTKLASLPATAFASDSTRTPLGARASRQHQGRLLYPPPDVWQVTRALFHRLNEDCRRQGSKLVIMVFPNVVDDPILARQIPDLEAMGRSEGFGTMDLTQAFRAEPDVHALFLQFHFSAAGHQVVARQLAGYLQDHR